MAVFSHITKDPSVCGGAASIDDTRIRVLDTVQTQSEGKTPQQMQDLFAVKLSLAQVYSALAYADENREEIETQYADHEQAYAEGRRVRDAYLRDRS